jgi:hypothetical protein
MLQKFVIRRQGQIPPILNTPLSLAHKKVKIVESNKFTTLQLIFFINLTSHWWLLPPDNYFQIAAKKGKKCPSDSFIRH